MSVLATVPLAELGYTAAIFPVMDFRAGAHAMGQAYGILVDDSATIEEMSLSSSAITP